MFEGRLTLPSASLPDIYVAIEDVYFFQPCHLLLHFTTKFRPSFPFSRYLLSSACLPVSLCRPRNAPDHHLPAPVHRVHFFKRRQIPIPIEAQQSRVTYVKHRQPIFKLDIFRNFLRKENLMIINRGLNNVKRQ